MTTIAQLAQSLRTLFTTTADEIARRSGFVERCSKLTGALFAQALVFGWLCIGAVVGWVLTRSDYPPGTPGAEPSVWEYPQQLFAPLILFGVPALVVGWRARTRGPAVDDWTDRIPGVVLTAIAAAFRQWKPTIHP